MCMFWNDPFFFPQCGTSSIFCGFLHCWRDCPRSPPQTMQEAGKASRKPFDIFNQTLWVVVTWMAVKGMQGIYISFGSALLMISAISNSNLKHFNLTGRNISKRHDETKIFCAKQMVAADTSVFSIVHQSSMYIIQTDILVLGSHTWISIGISLIFHMDQLIFTSICIPI